MLTTAANLKDFPITPEVLEENIIYAWEKKYQAYAYDDTEKTALILNNLYELLIGNQTLLKKAYETLISLNVENRANQERLRINLKELSDGVK